MGLMYVQGHQPKEKRPSSLAVSSPARKRLKATGEGDDQAEEEEEEEEAGPPPTPKRKYPRHTLQGQPKEVLGRVCGFLPRFCLDNFAETFLAAYLANR